MTRAEIFAAAVLAAGCGHDPARSPAAGSAGAAAGSAGAPAPVPLAQAPAAPLATGKPAHFPDLAAAVRAVVPADARVIGFGELHSRTDRAQVTSSLARFTRDVLPAIGAQLSDLVVETWIVDPGCGSAAQTTTAKLETAVRRPAATKSEIAQLADAARAAQIQPRAMHLSCADYATLSPHGGEPDPIAMLTITTRELGRVAKEAVAARDAQPHHRPWIAVYGGALHNDRFPAAGVEDWSYAAAVDAATANHYVEIDLYVPELAALDPASQKQPWFPLVAAAGADVTVWPRGERSYVIILPSSPP